MRRAALIGPPDSVTRLLADRLGLATGAACLLVPAPRRAQPAGAAPSYAEAAGETIVVYRPPWAGRRSGCPDLADAEELFLALAAPAAPADTGVRNAAAHRVQHFVLISSAAFVAPAHPHPGHVDELAPLPRSGNPIARAWAELERLALGALGASPGLALTVLRPTAVAARDGGDYLARLLGGRLALRLAGFDPSVQLLAPDDLARAVVQVVNGDPPPAGWPAFYQVAPAGVIPVRAALRLAHRRRLPVPYTAQRLARSLPARLGWAAPIEQLDWLRHSATVSGRRFRDELGFVPRATSAAAVAEAFGGAPAAAAAAPPPAAPEFDDYGMDQRYIERLGRTLFHFLHRYYWRVEVRGLEHVPRQGRAVLAGVHRGFQPWDGVMALHTLVRGIGRTPRFLIHPTLTKFPYLAPYMIKLGGIIACQDNADFVLSRDELLGMFPEGIQGAFTMYRDAYRLGKFGRDDFVKMALRHSAPIVPFVTAGSAEIFPIWGKIEWRWIRRLTEWPFLPLGPNFPLPGLPLPSKWHTEFLPPLEIGSRYPPEAAHDPAVVRQISQEVRGRMEEALGELRRRRKSIFYGAIFTPEAHERPPAARPTAPR
ncbi:MAG TPA: 1-acyl-sn-glycerol-3-phosphate acyltransferase [Thermoanaerobaculia bacterium]|nr:1-acyl-sn-glycerol-3-phosphate acyltransferase [Thermoanaerobaculia bacterium]